MAEPGSAPGAWQALLRLLMAAPPRHQDQERMQYPLRFSRKASPPQLWFRCQAECHARIGSALSAGLRTLRSPQLTWADYGQRQRLLTFGSRIPYTDLKDVTPGPGVLVQDVRYLKKYGRTQSRFAAKVIVACHTFPVPFNINRCLHARVIRRAVTNMKETSHFLKSNFASAFLLMARCAHGLSKNGATDSWGKT